MAVAAALTVVSCDKSEVTAAPDTEKQAQTLKLDLNIPSLDSDADTKAMKTGWVAGDKLNIWFDEWCPAASASSNVSPGYPNPDLIITYDGSKWTAGELKLSAKEDGTARSLKASGGKMTVLYEGYNDLSKYSTYWLRTGEWYNPTGSYESVASDKEVLVSNLTAYSEGLDYTYDDEANTLTATISSFSFKTQFKVLVKDIADDMKNAPNDYFLKVSCSSAEDAFKYSACGAFIVGHDSGYNYPHISRYIPNYKGCQRGVLEGNDLAFYYESVNITTAADIKFELYKTGETTAMSSYTATGKTITTSSDKCKGIYINYSKFSATATE